MFPIIRATQVLKPRFGSTSGSKLKHDGKNTVNVAAQGERLKVNVVVIDAVRPTISVATLKDKSSSVTFGTDGAHLHRETKGGGKRHGLIRKMRLLSLPTLVLATQVGGSGGLIAPIAIDVLQTEVTHHLGVDLGDMPSAVDDTPDPNGMPAPQEPPGEDIA